MIKALFILVLLFPLLAIAEESRPNLIFKGDGDPVAIVGMHNMIGSEYACYNHFGRFQVDELEYEGVSDIIAGIRVVSIGFNVLGLKKN